jgi:hypothetical protein
MNHFTVLNLLQISGPFAVMAVWVGFEVPSPRAAEFALLVVCGVGYNWGVGVVLLVAIALPYAFLSEFILPKVIRFKIDYWSVQVSSSDYSYFWVHCLLGMPVAVFFGYPL